MDLTEAFKLYSEFIFAAMRQCWEDHKHDTSYKWMRRHINDTAQLIDCTEDICTRREHFMQHSNECDEKHYNDCTAADTYVEYECICTPAFEPHQIYVDSPESIRVIEFKILEKPYPWRSQPDESPDIYWICLEYGPNKYRAEYGITIDKLARCWAD